MGSEMDMSDLLGVFLEEAEEQLQKLDDGILHLEKDPDDVEVLKEIFRAAHTLKGSSATMGLKPIAELTHAAESLLDVLRNGTLEADPKIVDLLLGSTDALRTLVSQVSKGEQMDFDTQELIANLKAACPGADAVKPQASAAKKQAGDSATEEAPSDALVLKLQIRTDCLMPSVRVFMIYNALTGLGTIISADPSEENIDDVQAGQEIRITFLPSQGSEEVIEAMRSLSEIDLIDFILPGAAAAKPSTPNEKKPAASAGGEAASEAPKAIQTVRVGVDRLDTLMNLVAELVIDRTRIAQIESDLSYKYEGEELLNSLTETGAHIARVVTELQEHIMKVRLLPVEQVFNRFPRMVRDLAHKVSKDIDFVMEGLETELDRSILEDIVDPINHLLRNAVDHGIETPEERKAAGKLGKARVVLAAKQEENRIIIEISDDGKGVAVEKVKAAALKKGSISEDVLSRMSDEDALQLIFASGISTAEAVTDISGRGVGMDVVRNNIQGLSGSVDVHTVPGQGTTFKISLPLTLAIIQALLTEVESRVFVIPLSAVMETFRCPRSDVRYIDGSPAINFRGSVLPIHKLGALFPSSGEPKRDEGESITFVVVNTGVLKVGFVVDRLIGEQEVVIKPLGSFFGDVPGIAGATILGDGRVALILDVAGFGGLLNRRRFARGAGQLLEAQR